MKLATRAALSLALLLQAAPALTGQVLVDDPLSIFGELGVPDLRDARLVKVWTGRWSQEGDDPPTAGLAYGYLLNDGGASFQVLTGDLRSQAFTRTGPGTPAHERVGWEPVDFGGFARHLVESVEIQDDGSPVRSIDFSPHMGPGVAIALHAWVARERGHVDLAHALTRCARRTLGRARREGDTGNELAPMLRDAIGHAMMWELIVDFGDPGISFADLHARCVRYGELFADHPHANRAADTADVLARMLHEAEQHRTPSAPLAELPPQQRAVELVYQLRTQNGRQWMQPGGVDMGADPRRDQSPYAQLVALGPDAVPALLDALDDNSFTRSVGYHRNFYFSHTVMRVRDCALWALAEITGERSVDADSVRHWYEQVRTHGEVEVWEEGTRQGNLALAIRLVGAQGDGASAALHAGLAAAQRPHVQAAFVAILASLDEPRAAATVREQLTGPDTDHRARLTAAWALLDAERELVIDSLLAALGRLAETAREQNPFDDALADIATFLVLTGEPRAIAALEPHIDRMDDDALRALGSGEAWLLTASRFVDGQVRSLSRLRDGPWPAESLEAVEDLLLAALASERIFRGFHGEMTEPGTADFAAQAFSRRFPERYSFDVEATRRERARQILAMRNAARARAGQPSLGTPAAPPIRTVDTALVEAVLARLRRAETAGDRRRCVADLVTLGLGAVPHLKSAMRRPRQDSEVLAALQDAGRQLNAIVVVAELRSGKLDEPQSLRQLLDAARGETLDPGHLLTAVAGFLRDAPPGVGGLEITVDRDRGIPGIQIRIRLQPDPNPGDGPWRSLGHHQMVRSGGRGLQGSSGAGVLDHDWFDDFVAALREAVNGPFDASIESRASIELRR